MLKFNRNYSCTIEVGKRNVTEFTPQEEFTIDSKCTLVFDIDRNMYSSANTAILRFYNIAPELQASLWLDPFQQDKYVKIILNAGYGTTMPRVFTGLATQCSTYRQSGGVDFITEIQATDSAFLYQYGFVNMTLSKGTKFTNFLNTLLSDEPDCELGYITDKIEALKKDTSFLGQTMDVLNNEYGQYQIFIDNGQLNVLDKDDVIPTDEIYVITAQSGLLGSPRRSDTTVELDMLFEPGIICGQKIKVLSDSMPWLNNNYKVIAISHRGVISPVMSGNLTTHLTLSLGKQIFNSLKRPSENTNVEDTRQGWVKPVSAKITGNYGESRSTHSHKGVDYGCPMYTEVDATHEGVVTTAGWVKGFGNCVYINHGIIEGNKVMSIYGHLSEILVSVNERVKTGQVIGLSGNTGISTGPHLHFQINENGNSVNPSKYIGGN